MRARDQYWALILVTRFLAYTVLIVTSMVVAIMSHGYWGYGGILVPTVAVIVLIVSTAGWAYTLDELAKRVHQKER